MVGCHGKLGVFLLDDDVVEVVVSWQFVTEADAFVIDTEADDYLPFECRLADGDSHLVVVVADVFVLAPYGLPCLVERALLHTFHPESFHQAGPVDEFQTERGG